VVAPPRRRCAANADLAPITERGLSAEWLFGSKRRPLPTSPAERHRPEDPAAVPPSQRVRPEVVGSLFSDVGLVGTAAHAHAFQEPAKACSSGPPLGVVSWLSYR
jgi:hypothetical protein